jgi:uncharacterized protein
MTNPIKLFLISVIFSSLYFTKIYAQKDDKSLLYEISGNGLTQPSYLYGTAHAICKKDFIITEEMKETFSSTKQVYLELDMDNPNMMSEMQKNMTMTDGSTLKSIMSETDYLLVNNFFKDSLKIDISTMPKIKPFVLSSFTIAKFLDCPFESYEKEFINMAKKESKEVLGLETVIEQFGAIDKLGMKKQADLMLVNLIKNWTTNKRDFINTTIDYKNQDIDALYDDMTKTSTYDADLAQNLLIIRNQNWIPKIAKIVSEKPTFFAVGAGHLGGEKGVIALLKKQGFTVKAVN